MRTRHLIGRDMEDQTSTQDSGWKVYVKVVKNIRDVFKRFKPLKLNPGKQVHDVARTSEAAYVKVIYRLMELILLDVADGTIVVVDKKRDAKFFVDFRPSSTAMIQGKGWKEAGERGNRIPRIDIRKFGYKDPIFAFDPGGKAFLTLVRAPKYLYSVLIENANAGTKYPKSIKQFKWYKDEK